MKILIVHNEYQYRGGEDAVVQAEAELLRSYGHQVRFLKRTYGEVIQRGVTAAIDAVWSRETTRDVATLKTSWRPDVIHAHNTFPLISPSLFWAADEASIPIIQTLHNFRLICPQAMFLRNGRICEECSGHIPWRAALYRCYRGSATQSGVLASALTIHRALGTYKSKVTRYIALNDFCRRKFVDGGLPADAVRIKPNFVATPQMTTSMERRGGLFVARLSPEKGLEVLARAAAKFEANPVAVVGAGPLEYFTTSTFGSNYLGPKTTQDVLRLMQRSSYLVVPSLWYENFPRTIVEAFSCGLPVIASRLGALPEIVKDGRTGLLFEPGSSEDLASKIGWAEQNPGRVRAMGEAAMEEYLAKYTPAKNYEILSDIYAEAINTHSTRM